MCFDGCRAIVAGVIVVAVVVLISSYLLGGRQGGRFSFILFDGACPWFHFLISAAAGGKKQQCLGMTSSRKCLQ